MFFTLLPQETAEVSSEYECIGHCDDTVVLAPEIDLSFAIKGILGYQDDKEEASQHTMYLSYKPSIGELDSKFSPGAIYTREGVHYVEMGYEFPMGIMMMNVYFLVETNDCIFGYKDESGQIWTAEYSWLWDVGRIRQMGK